MALQFPDRTIEAELVDQLPASGRLVLVDGLMFNDEPCTATVVQLRRGRVVARVERDADLHQQLIDTGWIKP